MSYPDITYNYALPENRYQPPPPPPGPKVRTVNGAFLAGITRLPPPSVASSPLDMTPPLPKGFITMVTRSGQVFSVDCFDLSGNPQAPFRR